MGKSIYNLSFIQRIRSNYREYTISIAPSLLEPCAAWMLAEALVMHCSCAKNAWSKRRYFPNLGFDSDFQMFKETTAIFIVVCVWVVTLMLLAIHYRTYRSELYIVLFCGLVIVYAIISFFDLHFFKGYVSNKTDYCDFRATLEVHFFHTLLGVIYVLLMPTWFGCKDNMRHDYAISMVFWMIMEAFILFISFGVIFTFRG